MLFKVSNLNSNLALTLGYLNPALNNSPRFLAFTTDTLKLGIERVELQFVRNQSSDKTEWKNLVDCWWKFDLWHNNVLPQLEKENPLLFLLLLLLLLLLLFYTLCYIEGKQRFIETS